MKCSFCSSEVDSNVTVCPNCGAAIEAHKEEVETPKEIKIPDQQQSEQSLPPSPPQSSSRNTVISIEVSIIAALHCIVGIAAMCSLSWHWLWSVIFITLILFSIANSPKSLKTLVHLILISTVILNIILLLGYFACEKPYSVFPIIQLILNIVVVCGIQALLDSVKESSDDDSVHRSVYRVKTPDAIKNAETVNTVHLVIHKEE